MTQSTSDTYEHIVLDHSTDVLDNLVARALGNDSDAASRLVTALLQYGLSADAILGNLFESAARRFGDLWQDDRCSDFDITVALGRLQSLTHCLEGTLYSPYYAVKQQRTLAPLRSVLVATAPGGSHMLAMVLSSEHFRRAGWSVTTALPQNDAELRALLNDHQFDVLDISMSSVFRDNHRLARMTSSIVAAREASLNSTLVVLASGRLFFERPELGLLVGADKACKSAADAASAAGHLMDAAAIPGFSNACAALNGLAGQIAAKAFRNTSITTA